LEEIQHWTQQLERSLAHEDTDWECTSLQELGLLYIQSCEYERGIETLNQALNISRNIEVQNIEDKKREANVHYYIGISYMRLSRNKESLESLNQALILSRECGDLHQVGCVYQSLGIVYRYLGQFDKAIKNLNQAKEIFRGKKSGGAGAGAVLVALGDIYRLQAQYDRAIEFYDQGLEIVRKNGYKNGEQVVLGNLGITDTVLGRYEKAFEYIELALSISRQIGSKIGIGTNLNYLGNVYTALGEYERGIQCYNQALAILREIKERNGEKTSLDNLGISYQKLRQYDKAIHCFNKAIVIAQDIEDKNGEGMATANLGATYFSLEQFEIAIEKLNEGIEISHETGNKYLEGVLRLNIGSIYLRLCQYEESIRYFNQSLEISRETGDMIAKAGSTGNLGKTYYFLDQYEEAIKYFQESLNLFDTLWKDLNEDERRFYFDDTSRSSLYSMYLQSSYHNLGKYEQALEVCERARSKSLELLLQEKNENRFSDRNHKRLADDLYTTMKKTAINMKSSIVVYSRHADSHVLIWVLRSEKNSTLVHKKVAVDRKKFKSLCYLVEATRKSIDVRGRSRHSGGDKKKIRSKLQRNHRGMILDVADNKHINEDFTEDDFYEVSAQLAKDDDCNEEQELDLDEVKTYFQDKERKAISKANKASIGKKIIKNGLKELYKILIDPIEDALKDTNEERLVIVPFGDLFSLPFAALSDRDGKYLIEKYVLSFVPSVGTLMELENRKRNQALSNSLSAEKRNTALVVGNPNYYNWMEQLPYAGEEAKQVLCIVEGMGMKAEMLEGTDATKEAVKKRLETAGIIHLASHGSQDGIYLSGSTEKEGKLTMVEVQNLSLEHAKMIVLSACDTFKGDLRTDGVIGITRAFIAAGAPTVIASMWPVNDRSTQEMMKRLYKELFLRRQQKQYDNDDEDSFDVCSALRQVMIGMLKEGVYNVRDWAPFLVYGLNTEGNSVRTNLV